MIRVTIRAPDPKDAADITKADAEGLQTGHASFRERPMTWASFSSSYLANNGLALVADENGHALGWAGVSATSSRDVYKGVGEVSVYIRSRRQGHGVGQMLLEAVISASEEHGYWTLVAQIFPENTKSLRLHRSRGFEEVGQRRKLGRMTYGPMAGNWRDGVMLERRSGTVGI